MRRSTRNDKNCTNVTLNYSNKILIILIIILIIIIINNNNDNHCSNAFIAQWNAPAHRSPRKKKSEPVTRRSEGAAIVGSTLIISILSTKK